MVGFVAMFGTPEVDGGLTVDVDGVGREARGGEAAAEVVAVEVDGAEKRR